MKADVILAVKAFNSRLKAIDKQLEQTSLSEKLWEPELKPSEYPRDRMNFSESDYEAFLASVQANEGRVELANCPMNSVCSKAVVRK